MQGIPGEGDGSFKKIRIIKNPPNYSGIINKVPGTDPFANFQCADFPRLRKEEDTMDKAAIRLLARYLGEKYADSAIGNVERAATEAGIDPILALEAAKARIENAITVRKIASGLVSFNYKDGSIIKL